MEWVAWLPIAFYVVITFLVLFPSFTLWLYSLFKKKKPQATRVRDGLKIGVRNNVRYIRR